MLTLTLTLFEVPSFLFPPLLAVHTVPATSGILAADGSWSRAMEEAKKLFLVSQFLILGVPGSGWEESIESSFNLAQKGPESGCAPPNLRKLHRRNTPFNFPASFNFHFLTSPSSTDHRPDPIRTLLPFAYQTIPMVRVCEKVVTTSSPPRLVIQGIPHHFSSTSQSTSDHCQSPPRWIPTVLETLKGPRPISLCHSHELSPPRPPCLWSPSIRIVTHSDAPFLQRKRPASLTVYLASTKAVVLCSNYPIPYFRLFYLDSLFLPFFPPPNIQSFSCWPCLSVPRLRPATHVTFALPAVFAYTAANLANGLYDAAPSSPANYAPRLCRTSHTTRTAGYEDIRANLQLEGLDDCYLTLKLITFLLQPFAFRPIH
ncbi:hypothetical protein Landi51_03391 [Colletotrichum acutatum]